MEKHGTWSGWLHLATTFRGRPLCLPKWNDARWSRSATLEAFNADDRPHMRCPHCEEIAAGMNEKPAPIVQPSLFDGAQ